MPFRSTNFRVFFAACAKLFCARGTVKKRTLYVHKAGARKLLISKELPISKKIFFFFEGMLINHKAKNKTIIIIIKTNKRKIHKGQVYTEDRDRENQKAKLDRPPPVTVKTEMVFSDYAKRRILVLRRRGNFPPTTSKPPRSDEIRASWRGILKFLLRYKQSCTIGKARLTVHSLF